MDEIARLRSLLAEEQRRRERAEELVEAEQRRLERAEELVEASQRRERAEELVEASQPQTLQSYLEACHSLSLAIEVVTNAAFTTKGCTTNPTGRVYPKRIIPWDDFPTRQEKIWDQLSGSSFASQRQFPSPHQLDYVRSLIEPISSEDGLRYFERKTLEEPVAKLIHALYEHPLLRDRLGLRGTLTFVEDDETDDTLSEAPLTPIAAVRNSRNEARARGLIYARSDGTGPAVAAIEYKAPHKLSQDEITVGLQSEIQPDRDVINKGGDDFAFTSRALTAAVVTQLFSYMVGKSIRYGYISTGQALVFLYIPDDPSIVYYYVCVPKLDVLDDDETRLHRTAVAQVFAFVLQAFRTPPPSLSWRDAAAALDTWAVELDDVLSRIPETARKGKGPRAPAYKPQRRRGFVRSPIRTRSRCKPFDTGLGPRDDGDDDDEEAAPPSPSAGRSTRSGKDASTHTVSGRGRGQRGGARGGGGPRGSGGRQEGETEPAGVSIQDRPYCTHQCLLGLAYGKPPDKKCPNARSHGPRHITPVEFLRLLRAQLAVDRGYDADSMPLYLAGAVGALFKLRLSAYGYTLVAKGVEAEDLARLQHEKGVYDRLRTIQGTCVPVCLGLIDLVLPYYYERGVFEHFLLLSWAGRPLIRCLDQIDNARLTSMVAGAYSRLHRLGILHGDAAPRNMVYDATAVMIVDFERAELCSRQPLGAISRNSQRLQEKRATQKKGDDVFAKELQQAVKSVSAV